MVFVDLIVQRRARSANPPAIAAFPPPTILFAAAVDVAARLEVAEAAEATDDVDDVADVIEEALLEAAELTEEPVAAAAAFVDEEACPVEEEDETAAAFVQRPSTEEGTVTPAVVQMFCANAIAVAWSAALQLACKQQAILLMKDDERQIQAMSRPEQPAIMLPVVY